MEKEERPPREEFEVCVVGGGVMGSCAAYSLAEAGKSTVLLEQFPLPHTRGSSSGHSRITSLSDYIIPESAPLVKHGYKKWMMMNSAAAISGAKFCPVLTINNNYDAIKAKEKKIKDTDTPPTWIDVDQLNSKYKSQIPSDCYALIDPSGLILVANKCVQTAQKLFQGHGGVILDGWSVKNIVPGKESIRVGCSRGDVRCKSLVLCPGPWASDVLGKIGLDLPLRTYKTGIWYYKLKCPDFPRTTINDFSIPKSFYYSTPTIEYPGLIKFGIHEGVEVSPDEREKADLTHLKGKMADYLEKFFPEIESEPAIEESCMYTMTPDEEFILDYHPEYKNIVYACGFSGRGFQLGPAIGDVLARMVLGQEDIYDLTAFKASRFASTSTSTSTSEASLSSKY